MTIKEPPVPFRPLLAIIGLVGLSYLPVPWLVAALWSDRIDWLIIATIITALTFPFAYWLLKRYFAHVESWPYFVNRFDLILPALASFFILFALIGPLPQFATFFWGQTTTGIVQDLQVERGVDLDRYYRVTVAYITETGGQWTKDTYTAPYHTIIVSRPSVNRGQVVVYTAVYRQNGSGFGKTATWERHPDGTWHDTDERLNWWIEGA